MSSLVIGAVLGGGDKDGEYLDALNAIQKKLDDVQFPYDFVLLLFVGGDMLQVNNPTGMISPRVTLTKKRVTARIRIHSDDAMSAADPGHLLRSAIFQSVKELFDRVAAKDKNFDRDAELRRIEFLAR